MKVLSAVIVALCLLISLDALGCAAPERGWGMTARQLAENADVIVLVETIEANRRSERIVVYELRVIETLKGKSAERLVLADRSGAAVGKETFSDHSDSVFWTELAGRSGFRPGQCKPDHGFVLGARYLLFPEMLGAMASAELIKSDSDRWLAFVRSTIE